MRYIRWFREISAEDVGLVGGKGANLGEMVRAGFPVPPGFCLTAAAYREFIQVAGLEQTILSLLDGARVDNPTDVEARTTRIRELIRHQPLPSDMVQEILDSYRRLGREHSAGETARLPVAVRSSATAEDLPTASFAGQQDTYLNVRGEAALLDKIKDCWASLWTTRAVVYRDEQAFDHHKVYLASVVQTMIQSEVSGILFTANPVTGNRAECVINASWGLGEAVVSGLVTPDTISVNKVTSEIIARQFGSKERAIYYAEDGDTLEQETTPEQQHMSALTDDQVSELVALGKRLENHYGTPQDVEWSYAHHTFYILQARPITTLAQQGQEIAPDDEYNRTMFAEIFPYPLSPVFLSVICSLFKSVLKFTFTTWGFKPPSEINSVGAFYNQPYFNRRYIETALEPLPPKVRATLVEQIVNPFGHHEGRVSGGFSISYLRMVIGTLHFMIRFPSRLPELIAAYQAQVAEVAKLPVETTSDVEIVESIRRLVLNDASRLMEHDFLMIAVIGRAYQFLGTLLHRYFGDATDEQVAKLVSGVTGNVTMEANKHLWDLAQLAKGSEAVKNTLREVETQAIKERLQETAEGKTFLAALDDFLTLYGHRESRPDILYPTWVEDLTPVWGFIRAYLDTDETQSPHRQQDRLVHERQQLTHEVTKRISRDLMGRALIAPVFRWLLNLSQVHTRERDTLHFELTRLFPPIRRLLFELGSRWSGRGLINQRDDVYFVTLDELAELAARPRSMKADILKRRTEYRTNQSRPWPNIIRSDQEIYAPSMDASEEVAANRLRGIAGSPGRVTGVARVIRGPEDFGKLQQGEILVAPLTNPVWTPLFAVAGGIVTEVGGILSHGAIVAREYGIPAVMSITGATTRLAGGQEVTVDGNRGIVILETETTT
jgi:pyruvate,water dikinase